MIRIQRILAALVTIVACGSVTVRADSSIKVVVNDQAITSFDIAQRLHLMQLTHEKGGEKAAIDGLIDEVLEVAEAKARGIDASDQRLSAAYAQIAQNMKMSPPQLDKALGSQGIVPETLKRRIKAQMVWSQVVALRARYQVTVKSSDVTAALFAKTPDKLEATEFTLQQIIFVVPKGSSAAYSQQRRREAEAFRGRYAGCDKALDQAKGLRDVTVRTLGRRMSADLTGKDGEDVQRTPIGKTSTPHSIDSGVELIGVCDAKKVTGDSIARAQIEDKLFLEKGKDVGKDYLKELRDKAIIKYR
jgi:peptidyl-prolyl cis-trans isomerase SurA